MQPLIQCLRDSAWEAIGTATVDGSEWHRYCKAWQTHCGLYQDTTGKIHAPHILTDRLLTFAVAVQESQYGKGHKVQVQSRSEPSPKIMFWTDILTHDVPHQPSCPWTSP